MVTIIIDTISGCQPGKKLHDKRQTLKDRDLKREADQAIKGALKK